MRRVTMRHGVQPSYAAAERYTLGLLFHDAEMRHEHACTRRVRAPICILSRCCRAALETIAPEAATLPGFAAAEAAELYAQLQELLAISPWRHMLTPGGQRMSVAMSNCGRAGWVSDRAGYRYQSTDPQSGRPWPRMPPSWTKLATGAAERAGFPAFEPDACLINRYQPGARLSLHQDRNERDLAAPVVSVSLGLPALFLFGGAQPGR